MQSALYELSIEGIVTNQSYQEDLLRESFFQSGEYHTLSLDSFQRGTVDGAV